MVTISFPAGMVWGRALGRLRPWKANFCAGLGVAAVLTLTGCATASNGFSGAARHAVLQAWVDLTGARAATLPESRPAAGRGAGYIVLRRPSAVSADGNDVYLVDSGLRRIFRYDRAQQTLTPFTDFIPGNETKVYAAPDLTLYVIDPSYPQVLHFAWNGAALAPLSSPGNLDRPVSMAVDKNNGQVLVADGLYQHIVVFNSLGRPLSVIRPQRVRALGAMALAEGTLYLLDRLARQVVAVDLDGAYRYAIGAGALGLPSAVATYGSLVLIGDDFDQTVKVFRGERLIDTAGGEGAASGHIAGMAVDSGLLYVADSLNARIRIMLISPEAVRKNE